MTTHRGPFHRIDVVLAGVAAGQEEVLDRGALIRPVGLHAGSLAVQRLSQLHHIAPGEFEMFGRGEEIANLLWGQKLNIFATGVARSWSVNLQSYLKRMDKSSSRSKTYFVDG